MLGRRVWRAGQGLSALDFEIDGSCRNGIEVEVARVDGFAGVVEGGGIGGPVGGGLLVSDFASRGEGDVPIGAEIGEPARWRGDGSRIWWRARVSEKTKTRDS